jgi:methionyl-tRNA formyltransferase
MHDAAPDLGVIYGTNIINETVFKIPRLGSLNVHQGLAPWYRGGPPVFWELYNGEQEVGITVHFVESKVDSGEIVLQQTVPLNYDYAHGSNYEHFLDDYQVELQNRCASLLAESVRLIAVGTAAPIPQDPKLGTRYRLPTKAQKNELRRRLRRRQIQCGGAAFKSSVNICQEPRRTDEASSA